MGAIIMIVYEATKQSFLEDVYNDQVAKKIKARLGFNVGSSTIPPFEFYYYNCVFLLFV